MATLTFIRNYASAPTILISTLERERDGRTEKEEKRKKEKEKDVEGERKE